MQEAVGPTDNPNMYDWMDKAIGTTLAASEAPDAALKALSARYDHFENMDRVTKYAEERKSNAIDIGSRLHIICSLAECDFKESQVNQFKKCSRCKVARYCCSEHQKQDWNQHKTICLVPV